MAQVITRTAKNILGIPVRILNVPRCYIADCVVLSEASRRYGEMIKNTSELVNIVGGTKFMLGLR